MVDGSKRRRRQGEGERARWYAHWRAIRFARRLWAA